MVGGPRGSTADADADAGGGGRFWRLVRATADGGDDDVTVPDVVAATAATVRLFLPPDLVLVSGNEIS